ncbi:hypothetical protein C8F01DRAFT_1377534 [Mycena amicta]|nr:hypothetical protein C8F01DRAFT_1377534 [Mycena amicta]
MTWTLSNAIWLEILRYLPRKSLLVICTTARNLCSVSRGLLFAHLDFHPYVLDDDDALSPDADEVERQLARLAFWSSDAIASLVRSCEVSPSPTAKVHTPSWGSPYVLLDAFLEKAPRFTGLLRLSLRQLRVPRDALFKLSSLATLKNLEVTRCDMLQSDPEPASSLRLAVNSLLISHDVAVEDVLEPWLNIVDPTHLRTLMLSCSLKAWTNNPENIPSFPMVGDLSIRLNFALVPENIRILQQFPVVEKLEVNGSGASMLDVPEHVRTILPKLKILRAPRAVLPLFLRGDTLQRLTVKSCNPRKLAETLRSVGVDHTHATHATTLELNFDDTLSPETLTAILELFPTLASLKIDISLDVEEVMLEDSGINPIATEFFLSLPNVSFPPTLASLAITWSFEYPDLDEAPTHDLYEFNPPEDLRDRLMVKCHHLTRLWLDGKTFLYWWRVSEARDGEDWEGQFGEDEYEAAALRDGFDVFCGTSLT